VPVWPNIVASLFCFAFILVKLRALDKLHKLHHQEAMQLAKDHHAEVMGSAPTSSAGEQPHP
jgi:hypothetical protein